MKLFHMGELLEGEETTQGWINLVWYEVDTVEGIRAMTTLLIVAFPWLGTHYDIPSREVRYGWWLHSFWLAREDLCPLPTTRFYRFKYFYKEKVSANQTGTGKLQASRRPDSKSLIRSQSDYGTELYW